MFYAWLAGVLLSFAIPPGHAQEPETQAGGPYFEIERYDVKGNTLLEPRVIERITTSFSGKQKSFTDIQRTLEALEIAYREAGYGSVQAQLPEQDITSGVVLINVIQPRITRISVEGNQHFDTANVRRSVPALREGVTPNSKEIAKNLAVANENPAKQTTVLMRSGEADDQAEMTLRLVDAKPWTASATLNNTGATQTGDYRVSLGYQHANLFNRDHVLSLQYLTSPNHLADVKIYGLGYRVPLYSLGSSLELIGGYSNVNSGTVGGLFTVSGAGTVAGLHYNQILPKWGNLEQKLVAGLDYRAFQNSVLANGVNLVPDITLHPVSLTYQGTLRREGSEAGVYLSVAQNVFPGGNDGTDNDFKASRADAKAGYRVYRYGANYARALPRDWQVRVLITGQHTDHALVSGEQFGIGGAENLRGFLERAVANDRGYRGSVELYAPDLASIFHWTTMHGRLLGFYDWGTVTRNSAQPGESSGQSPASAGFGMRLNAGKSFTARVDYAHVLHGAGAETTGHTRVHMSISFVY